MPSPSIPDNSFDLHGLKWNERYPAWNRTEIQTGNILIIIILTLNKLLCILKKLLDSLLLASWYLITVITIKKVEPCYFLYIYNGCIFKTSPLSRADDEVNETPN